MPHEILMDDDGILRLSVSGDYDKTEVDAFYKSMQPFLKASTAINPLFLLIDSSQLGKIYSEARKFFAQMNADPLIGQVAVVGANRQARVLGSFIIKATGRDNIRFFDNDEDAAAWLKARM